MDEELVVLFDVDDTLLDNDSFEDDLRDFISAQAGAECADRYFAFFEEIRTEVGFADFIGAFQRYRLAYPTQPQLLEISAFLMEYPFDRVVFAGAFEAIAAVRERPGARPVILSDGDGVFQPHKLRVSGLLEAVDGDALIFVHKERMLDEVRRRYPAERYLLVDDKLRILDEVKRIWGDRVETVLARQGKHALSSAETDPYPDADHTIDSIGGLVALLDREG